jgi:REP element-mobilizing transposase RayT
MAREELDDTNAKYFACQRERDLLKIKAERLENTLKEKGLWNEAEMAKNDEEDENNDIKLVEEYNEKIEEYKRISDEKEKYIRRLNSENEALEKKSEEESTLLQEKAHL